MTEQAGGSDLRRWSWWIGTGVALFAVVVPVMLEWWCPPFASRCETPRPGATILSPEGEVERAQLVTGTSEDIPDDRALWVVLYIPAVERFYPADFPATIDADGNWSSRLLIGQEGDQGIALELIVVTADSEARAAFEAYLERSRTEGFGGLPGLPAGTRVLDRAEVVRL